MATRSSTVTGLGAAVSATCRLPGGVELRQLSQPEIAVRELGVWNRQVRLAHAALAPPHDVQVQRAGTPPQSGVALAAALRFDHLQVAEQRARLERGLEQDHLVQEGSLAYGAERRRLFDARCRDEETAPLGPIRQGAFLNQ